MHQIFPKSKFFLAVSIVSLVFSFASAKTLQLPSLKKVSADLSVADTLEVFCLYVQFKAEDSSDEGSTTGLGTFGSAGKGKGDPDKLQNYTLDPNGNLRAYKWYLEKHFDFAKNYFEKVSKGRVTVKTRIFPKPDDNGRVTPYSVALGMKNYNPSELDKDAKQKISDFSDERAQKLMSFVYDVAKVADDKSDSTLNPFLVARAEAKRDSIEMAKGNLAVKRKHRCYLIFHAGHSRLVDGGNLGALGANSPNDFTDFFVTKDDFKALDSATILGNKGGDPDKNKRAAARGVPLSTGDTLTEVMMLSEAASQEKVNWGINGILINQLARQMGMPDMFDVVKGISQLGSFDLMDFAGYNTLNGFIPVYPSAWVRTYMGWEDPVVARPDANESFSTYSIWSPNAKEDPAHITTVKVPINDREYFLIENRQRAGADTTVTVYFDKQASATDLAFSVKDSITVPFAYIDSIFVDSICKEYNANKSCKTFTPNPKKPKGIITGASSYDLGLPASGLLVWHVNEWFISQFLKYGAVNAYLGDTLRSQFKGVELVEADGALSIGKEFKDGLGQPAFDYGSGSDLLPHIFRKRKNPPKDTTWSDAQTLDRIGPYGAANTNAWNDARTHFVFEAPLPDKPLFEKSDRSFYGDSIFTVRDSVLVLKVYWPDNQTVKQNAGSLWPARLDTATTPQSLNILKNPAGGNFVISLSDRGLTQVLTPSGKAAIAARDTLRPRVGYDSVKTLLPSGKTQDSSPIPVNSLSPALGKPIGTAIMNDTLLATLTTDSLQILHLVSAGLAKESKDSSAISVTIPIKGAAGPLVLDDRIWVITKEKEAKSFDANGNEKEKISLPDFEYQSMAALPNENQIALVAKGAKVVLIDIAKLSSQTVDKVFGEAGVDQNGGSTPNAETFTVSSSDFNRDGKTDLFLLGSKGASTLIGLQNLPKAEIFPGFPQRFPRTVHFVDSVDTTKKGETVKKYRVKEFDSQDSSPPALADLNGDGYPDIIFTGTNSVFAIDYRGALLKGWPFLPELRQNIGFTYGSSRHPETVIGSMPLVINLQNHLTVLIGSPDGLILAVDSLGRKLTSSSFDPSQKSRFGILSVDASDWPLTMGGITLDSNDNSTIQLSAADLDGDGALELLAQSGTGNLNVWTLKKSSSKVGSVALKASASNISGAMTGPTWLMAGGNGARQNFFDVSTLNSPADASPIESIEEFFLFPSPVRGPVATVHLKIGADAKGARLRIYDLAGVKVKDQSWENLPKGLQAYNQVLDVSRLGADVYTALIEVTFASGTRKKWVRFGVIR